MRNIFSRGMLPPRGWFNEISASFARFTNCYIIARIITWAIWVARQAWLCWVTICLTANGLYHNWFPLSNIELLLSYELRSCCGHPSNTLFIIMVNDFIEIGQFVSYYLEIVKYTWRNYLSNWVYLFVLPSKLNVCWSWL